MSHTGCGEEGRGLEARGGRERGRERGQESLQAACRSPEWDRPHDLESQPNPLMSPGVLTFPEGRGKKRRKENGSFFPK